MSDEDSHRRVYAKGFFDGLRSLGIDEISGASIKDLKMNNAKFQQTYRGLTSICQKVLDAVPIEGKWTVQQIMSEMARTGSVQDKRKVEGCLNSLIGSSLISEPETGRFRRVPVREPAKLAAVEKEEIVAVQEITQAQSKQGSTSPLDKLAALSSRVRQIQEMMKNLASDIDDAAIAIEEQMSAVDEDTKKLRQLQQLLKSIS